MADLPLHPGPWLVARSARNAAFRWDRMVILANVPTMREAIAAASKHAGKANDCIRIYPASTFTVGEYHAEVWPPAGGAAGSIRLQSREAQAVLLAAVA
jgi:hypothetical protein